MTLFIDGNYMIFLTLTEQTKVMVTTQIMLSLRIIVTFDGDNIQRAMCNCASRSDDFRVNFVLNIVMCAVANVSNLIYDAITES